MRKIALCEYVSLKNSGEANSLIQKWGLPPAKNPKDLADKMTYILRHKGEAFLNQLAMIHPDRALILGTGDASTSSACGCSSGCDGGGCKCGGKCAGKSSAEGDASAEPKDNSIERKIELGEKKYAPWIAISTVAIILTVILTKGK